MADEYFRIFETAWESFSGWMSEKISSLSSMASNVASTIMTFRSFNAIEKGEVKIPKGEELAGVSWNGILPGENSLRPCR